MPRTCAIVLNYFGSRDTEACVDSLATAPVDTLYIVDNSADEEETRKLRAMIARFVGGHPMPRLVLLVSPQNLGFSRGVNSAVHTDLQSEGHDHYLLLNNDARATPGMVVQLIRRIGSEPDCLAVSPRVQTSDGRARGMVWYHRYLGFQCLRKHALTFPAVSGCCLLLNRAAIRDGILLDERFFMYGEDVALCWRIHRSGWRVLIDDHARVLHEGSQTSRYGSLFYEYHVARGHVLLAMTTWVSPLEVPLMLTTQFLSLLARALVRAVRLRRLAPLAAFALAWLPMGIRAVPPPAPAAGAPPAR
ncbi:MAG: glycosyltransferase family 2 protein [Acidiferrobacteraceae bacterium]